MTAIGSVSRGSPPSRRAMRAKAWFAIRRPNGTRSRFATTSASSGVTESATTATIRGRGASTVRGGSGGVRVGRGEAPVAQDRHRGDRRDAAHRRADQGHPPDPPLAQPGERAGHVLDLGEPEAGRRVVGPAVAPEVQAQHARGPAQERTELQQVGRHRAAPAVQQQDRLARVGRPSLPGLRGQPAADRRTPSRDRSRTTSPPSRSSAGAIPDSSGRRRGASISRRASRSATGPTARNATTGAAATSRTRRITRRQRRPRAAARSCPGPRSRRSARRGG